MPASAYGKQLKLPLDEPKLVRRFMAKVEQHAGHWYWRGRRNKGGYGQFWAKGRAQYAHRVSYALFVGVVPAGKDVMHKTVCAQPECVNPECLEVGTKTENNAERWERYWGNAGKELRV